MQASQIFETVLYAEDLLVAADFYKHALGLELLRQSDLLLVFRCGGGVLLIFDPRKSGLPGREVPSHGVTGAGHVAFAARAEELEAWKAQLRQAGVAIEQEVEWPEGGRSIYFRDPAGNSVELAPPTLWGGRWKF
jgi:catechol 2,3-dioxygenase-like lactoylglutathione lyase family enzyme